VYFFIPPSPPTPNRLAFPLTQIKLTLTFPGDKLLYYDLGGEKNTVGKKETGDPGVDWRIILGWNFMKWGVRVWTGSGWFRIETGGGKL
jgi:hypothetical protein